MKIERIHHVTAITNDRSECRKFYQEILGLNLLSESVVENLPHLYFGDSEQAFISFIESNTKGLDGTDEIYAFCLRVPTNESLYYFKQRFDDYHIQYDGVIQLNNRYALPFYDCDSRLVYLISDENNAGVPLGVPYEASPVEPLHQVTAIGPVLLKVQHTLITASMLNQMLSLDRIGEYDHHDSNEPVQVFQMGKGGNGGEIHLMQQGGPAAHMGAGRNYLLSLALRDKAALNQAVDYLKSAHIAVSRVNQYDQYTSQSFKDMSGIIFELGYES